MEDLDGRGVEGRHQRLRCRRPPAGARRAALAAPSTTVDYPPVALYELGAAGLVYRLFDPRSADARRSPPRSKVPGLIFGIALTMLFWWTVRRLRAIANGRDWVALAYWANPRPS